MRIPPNRERILGHPVNALSNSEALGLIIERALEGTPGAYVCLTNVATTVLSQRSPQLRTAVEGAFISMPDGMPLVWILRRRGFPATEKLTGADLMPQLAKAGRGHGVRHFLYGWTNRMSQAAGRGLVDAVPGSLVVGTHSPPFAAERDPAPDDLSAAGNDSRPLAPPWVSIGASVSQADWEIEKLEVRLEETRPHILWVGLGSPVQEEWMAMVAGRLRVPVMIGVGRAFNYAAGALRRCPEWMINTGFEWLYVFVAEPRRLWKRYILGSAYFSYLIARDAVVRRLRNAGPKM
jgi:N-acetylglucosaminyldiphosphoundecaprenol N-acetyl-beta-D-mannosaminyltransferase